MALHGLKTPQFVVVRNNTVTIRSVPKIKVVTTPKC